MSHNVKQRHKYHDNRYCNTSPHRCRIKSRW